MKQIWVVLSLCLSLLGSAAFAPFVHRHTDAAHATDHHDGRVVHGHAAAHVSAVAHHHDTDATVPAAQVSSEEARVEIAGPLEAVFASSGVRGVRAVARQGALVAVAEVVTDFVETPPPTTSPPDDVGVNPPSPIDHAPSLLRGPPK